MKNGILIELIQCQNLLYKASFFNNEFMKKQAIDKVVVIFLM